MICSMCRRETRSDLRYCEYCGAQILGGEAGYVPPPTPAPSPVLPSFTLPAVPPAPREHRDWTPSAPAFSLDSGHLGPDAAAVARKETAADTEAFVQSGEPRIRFEVPAAAPEPLAPPEESWASFETPSAPESEEALSPSVETQPEVLSVGRILGVLFLALLPVVNLIALLTWALGRQKPEGLRNLAQALLLFVFIWLILLLASVLVLVICDLPLLDKILHVFS